MVTISRTCIKRKNISFQNQQLLLNLNFFRDWTFFSNINNYLWTWAFIINSCLYSELFFIINSCVFFNLDMQWSVLTSMPNWNFNPFFSNHNMFNKARNTPSWPWPAPAAACCCKVQLQQPWQPWQPQCTTSGERDMMNSSVLNGDGCGDCCWMSRVNTGNGRCDFLKGGQTYLWGKIIVKY